MHFKKLRAMSACASAISVTNRQRSEIIKRFGAFRKTPGAFRQQWSFEKMHTNIKTNKTAFWLIN